MTLFTRNWRLKVVAVVFATLTWGVVAYAGNPVLSRDVQHVPVAVVQQPNGWVLTSQLSPVTVTVTGLKASLDQFQASSLHAYVDLGGARLGTNLVKVHVDNADPHVSVSADPQPAEVEVTLDEKDSVTKKVDLRLGKNPPNSCCATPPGSGKVTPDSVRLTGPKSIVAKALPYVVADVTEARTDVQLQNVDIKLDGVSAREAALVTIEPLKAQSVTVPVTLVKKTISVGVRVVDSGQVASGYEVADIRYTPDIVTVQGDPSVLTNLTTIDTDTISLAGATNDVVRSVGLRPPPGVTVVGISTIRVTITVNPIPGPSPAPSPNPSPSPSR